MRGPTQRELTRGDLARYVRAGLGPDAVVVAAGELTGGGFATVWRLTVRHGERTRDLVLKVGPAPGTRLLSHEAGLAAAEADYYRRVPAGVPVPQVLGGGPDWLLVTHLPGVPLSELGGQDTARARYATGAALARVHTVTGPRFGYPEPRVGGRTWPAAFATIVEALLADAVAWDVAVPADRIRAAVHRHHDRLAAAERPALLHVDLWDGNVLVGADGSLTGLVDGERHLYGDPLLDAVSPALFRHVEDEPDQPFLRGYADTAGAPLHLDPVRLALYRMHLYLTMVVELPSRGRPPGDEFLTGLLAAELDALHRSGLPSQRSTYGSFGVNGGTGR